jgi:hypothetical protein
LKILLATFVEGDVTYALYSVRDENSIAIAKLDNS